MKPNKIISSFSIQPGEIHVWVFNLEGIDQSKYYWGLTLSEDELDRSKRYVFEKDRLRFTLGRGILRQLLSLYTGIDPAEIKYLTNPYGKLFLPSYSLSFNISKSFDRIAFAFSMEAEIGVDIEQIRPIPDLTSLMEFCFSPEERAELSIQTPAAQLEAFYHVWTQKEAFLKAQGTGLTMSLQDISVSVDPDKPGRLIKFKGGDASLYQMISHVPEPGCRLAVCVQMKNKQKVKWLMPKLTDFLSGYELRSFDPAEARHP
jgi:4'-phosphopantetheinyl transferase